MANPNLPAVGATGLKDRQHLLRLERQVGRKLKALIQSGVHPDDAVSVALDEVINDPINAELDWVELLPMLMEFIMLLLEIFARQKKT